ncbi:hypothetical protein DFQ28_009318 [Apophysomyces sp. BC1034]|nr:hypothetical protein DFQ28_009318 [Apophysomyces sp. BC1034]
MYTYPVKLEKDTNGSWLVTFPDIPEATSVGDDEDEALLNALDALESAIEIYFDDKREVPVPSKARKGQPTVTLPALITAKVLLANEMVRQGVRKAELARRLDLHMPQIDRLLDPRHASKLDMIERAFGKLGKHLEVFEDIEDQFADDASASTGSPVTALTSPGQKKLPEIQWPRTKALLDEAATLFLSGEPDAARLILRDLVNATVGFESLAELTHKPSKSLHRMLSAKGNPNMDNLATIFGAVRNWLKVTFDVRVVEMA